MSNLGSHHWRALERAIHYLKGIMSYVIHYLEHFNMLEGYSDSSRISNVDELYATSGYVFTVGGGAVSWRSCKQTIFTALDTASVEADWLRELLMYLHDG